MIYITKCSICLSFIYRYSQVSNLVSCRAGDFLSSRLQHKSDPGLTSCEIHNQFQRTDCTTLTQSFFGSFFWYYLVLNFLWTEVGDCDLWHHKQHCACPAPVRGCMMTGRIYKQLCTSWMPSGGSNEHLTKRDFWQVSDQIVTYISEVMTADICIM